MAKKIVYVEGPMDGFEMNDPCTKDPKLLADTFVANYSGSETKKAVYKKTLVDPETGEELVLGGDETFKFHDDAIHIEYHTHFVLSPEFEKILPAAQRIALMHLNSHQDALEQKQQKMLMQQMAAQEAVRPSKQSETAKNEQ